MKDQSSTQLHVAYLINQYPAGSHTFIRREIGALELAGVKVMRIALRGWNTELVDEADRQERAHTRYVLAVGAAGLLLALMRTAMRSPRLLARAAKLSWRMFRQSERSLAKHLASLGEACLVRDWAVEGGCHHLHAHFATNSAEVAMLASALGGPRYSFTAHGSDIMDRPSQVGLPMTVGNAAFAVAVCSFGRSQMFRWIPFEQWSRIHVVGCGLEPDYAGGGFAIEEMPRRLLCIGRLSKEKGQILLVQAAQKLAQAGVVFDLVLAGDGSMRDEIERLIAHFGLADRIAITGWLDAAGIERELAMARALVVPSLSEGLPIVIMEAMASRRPVVAPYLAGIPELVRDGRTGWLFPSGDVESLASAMRSCLEASKMDLSGMGEAARRDVFATHDIHVEVRKLITLFENPAMTVNASEAPE